LASTENSVRTARNRFSSAVNDFNKKIKQIPANIFAGMFGFDEMARFKAAAGSEDAPDIDFDFSK
jgi:LemA protein